MSNIFKCDHCGAIFSNCHIFLGYLSNSKKSKSNEESICKYVSEINLIYVNKAMKIKEPLHLCNACSSKFVKIIRIFFNLEMEQLNKMTNFEEIEFLARGGEEGAKQ